MRTAFNRFVERYEVPWELTMGLLAVVYVTVGLLWTTQRRERQLAYVRQKRR